MGAGGARDVGPVNKRIAQLVGRQDFKRNNPVGPLQTVMMQPRLHNGQAICQH